MPTYEYECQEHSRFEVRQPMSSELKATCPKCNKPAEPRISLSNFRMAIPLTVVDNGKILHYKPDGGSAPPPVEDLARDEKKGMY